MDKTQPSPNLLNGEQRLISLKVILTLRFPRHIDQRLCSVYYQLIFPFLGKLDESDGAFKEAAEKRPKFCRDSYQPSYGMNKY